MSRRRWSPFIARSREALSRPRKLAVVVFLLASFRAVVACNAVLGIEPAELDETVNEPAECDWPQLDPSQECFSNTCEAAASACPVDGCLKNADCRRNLRDFRKCAGDSCEAKADRCEGCVADNAQARTLAKCLEPLNCGLSDAYSLCESYCECMEQKCPVDQPGGASSCLATCAAGNPALEAPFNAPLPAWQAYCFWDHCERVSVDSPNDGFHCHHAVGIGSNCKVPSVADPNAPVCMHPQGYGNAPCDNDDDCCATCDEARGVCEPP
jgi:hypothetical protein